VAVVQQGGKFCGVNKHVCQANTTAAERLGCSVGYLGVQEFLPRSLDPCNTLEALWRSAVDNVDGCDSVYQGHYSQRVSGFYGGIHNRLPCPENALHR